MTNRKYGWIPQKKDDRDKVYRPSIGSLPPSIDLTSKWPDVYDQSQIGSCTANGIAFAIQFDAIKQGVPDTSVPSRLFIYYNERLIENSVNYDSGANIRDGIKSVNSTGVCDETL